MHVFGMILRTNAAILLAILLVSVPDVTSQSAGSEVGLIGGLGGVALLGLAASSVISSISLQRCQQTNQDLTKKLKVDTKEVSDKAKGSTAVLSISLQKCEENNRQLSEKLNAEIKKSSDKDIQLKANSEISSSSLQRCHETIRELTAKLQAETKKNTEKENESSKKLAETQKNLDDLRSGVCLLSFSTQSVALKMKCDECIRKLTADECNNVVQCTWQTANKICFVQFPG